MNNTLFTGDNLHIMHGMNSESVDLIYLDPPFNSKRTYSAPIGSKAAGASFKDMWTWADVDKSYLECMIDNYPYLVQFIKSVGVIHGKPMMSYVTFMTQRILEMHRILKPTGSLYLHCDPTASHYLKIVLDRIFGVKNFRNEVVWCYKASNSPVTGGFPKKHDIILFYSKSSNIIFNKQFMDYSEQYIKKMYRHIDKDGRRYRTHSMKADGTYRKYYLDEMPGSPVLSWWTDILGFGTATQAKERTGYPTQKPKALLKRIIEASSNEGDVVFDPFCGCATTCVVAQKLKRQWIGIDIEKKAAELVIMRLSNEQGIFKDFIHRTDIPKRTDVKIEKEKDVKKRLFEEQKGKCNGCRLDLPIKLFEVDHIVPKSKGGGDYYENYQLLCGNCNRIKGDKPMSYLNLKIKAIEDAMQNDVTFGGK